MMEQCRACLCTKMRIELNPLRDKDDSSVPIMELYSIITSIEVELVGANPRYICWDCTNILIRLHQFREMCLQSEKCLSTTLSDSNDFQDQRQSEDENSPKIDQIDCRQSATQFSSVSTSKRPRFECDMCGQTFFKKHRIEAHLRNKFGLKPFRCTDCGVSFRKFCSLRAHQRRQHPSDGTAPTRFAPKKYACTVSGCQRAYTERSSLSLHCQRKHSDAPPTARLVCDACGQVCPSNSAFQEHMWRHRDPAEYPYACELCPKRFINKYAFQTHQNRHQNIRNFQCTLCDARTYTKAELDIHTAYHNKAPTVVCEQCPDKRFTTKLGLRRHVKIAHEGRKPYVCADCGLGFSTKHVMQNHRLRHTGEKPHACPVCDRRFTQLVTMKTHLKVHTKRINHCVVDGPVGNSPKHLIS